MAIDESEQLDRLKDCLGHYILAVAAIVMRDGVPVTTGGPYTYPDPGEPEEAELTLHIPDDYAARCLGNGGESMSLDWTSTSGWSIYLAFRLDDKSYSQTERWLGAGLVPPPRQVANFLATAMVDWQTAGSPEQPFYRNRGQDLAPVLARLTPYLPDEEPATKGSFEYRFAVLRRKEGHQLAVADTLSDNTIRAVPMRAGEVKALHRLLDWLSSDGDSRRFALSLADDLQARFSGSSVTPPGPLWALASTYQTAWEQASANQPEGSA